MYESLIFIKSSHFVFAGNSCFEFDTPDKKNLVLKSDLCQDVLTKAKGDLIVILEVTF